MKALDKRTCHQWLPYLGVLIAAIPLIIGRDFTPDNELRYLSIADEALANHQYMAFTNHGVPYADKPPLYLWIVTLCRLVAGGHYMWLLSLFSLIPAFLCCAIMQRWIALKTKWSEAAAWMLLTGAYFFGLSVTLRMDMLMTLFIVLAMRSFWILYKTPESKSHRWWFPLWIFLAVFSKGPLGILIPLLSSVVFLIWQKRIRSIRRFWGWRTWIVLLLLCGAWFGGVALDGGSDYLDNLLVHQTVGRAVNAFHHKRPIWYYCIAFWYSIAPWSLALVAAVTVAAVKKKFDHPLDRLLLTVCGVTFVMLSCFSSKIQVYLLPIFPFIAFLGARLMQNSDSIRLPARLCLAIPAFIFIISPLGINLYGGRFLTGKMLSIAFYASYLLLLGGSWAWQTMFLSKRHDAASAIRALAIGLMGAVFVVGLNIDCFNPLLGYGKIVHAAEQYVTDGSTVYTYGLSRSENMDALLGCKVIYADTLDIQPKQGDLIIRKSPSRKLKIEIYR